MRVATVLLTICTAAFALETVPSAAGPIVESGNLLVNPGAETGALSPWESIGFSVSDQPATLPAGTIDATEGDWWFRTDMDIAITADDGPPGTIVKVELIPMQQKFIDVQGLGHIESITFGGDAFGVYEVLGGNPQLVRMDVAYLVQLLDEDMNPVGNGAPGVASFGVSVFMEENPDQEFDFRETVSISEQPAFLRFLAQMNPRVVGTLGDSVRFRLGFDDLHLSLTYQVPEPSTFGLAVLGTLLLFFGPARRGIRARMDRKGGTEKVSGTIFR